MRVNVGRQVGASLSTISGKASREQVFTDDRLWNMRSHRQHHDQQITIGEVVNQRLPG